MTRAPPLFWLCFSLGCGQISAPIDTPTDGGGDGLVVDSPNDITVEIVDGGIFAIPPDQIFGKKLVLWLDADQPSTLVLDDAGVNVWKDRGPYQLDAITLGRDGGGITPSSGVANGHGALRIGAQQGFFDVSTLTLTFVAIVAAYTNPAAMTSVLVEHRCGNDEFPPPQFDLLANWMSQSAVFAGTPSANVVSSGVGWNDGKFHSFGFLHTESPSEIAVRVDGIETRRSLAFSTSGGGPMSIGASRHFLEGGAPVQNSLEGYVAEVIVAINTPGTPLELAQLNAYLEKKYGLPF